MKRFRNKITISCLPFILLFSISSGLVFFIHYFKIYHKILETKALLVVRFLAVAREHSEECLSQLERQSFLRGTIKGILKDAIIGASFYNPDGSLIIGEGESFPLRLNSLQIERMVRGALILDKGKDINNFFAPVRSFYPAHRPDTTALGFVGVTISLKGINNMRNLFLTILITVGLFLALLGVGVSSHLGKRMTLPIAQLIEGTKTIADGNLDYQIEIKSEDELKSLASFLNRMAQRLKETESQLIEKTRLAAIGELAAEVAHDLRNPLSVIKNVVYFLRISVLGIKDTQMGSLMLKNLNLINTEIARANKIITDLLEFSRERTPRLIEVNLNAVVEETLKNYSFPENIKLNLQLSPNSLVVKGDDVQLLHCFINIISNAVEAMPDGGELTIITKKNSSYGEVEFKDTGPGIPKEDLGRIFQPFFSTKARGIGLGLAVTKKLITAQGGKIEVASELGRGTTFRISLPRGD